MISNENEDNKNQEEIPKDTKKLIYDDENHLKELLKEIVTLHKDDGYNNFEKISMFIKEKMTKLSLEYKPSPYKFKPYVISTPIEKQICQENLKVKKTCAEVTNHYMDDILQQSSILEWAGISFNKTEWYKLRIAMKKLLVENNCEYIRFFGKIFGIKSDYYIMQGIEKNYPMKNPPKHEETKGNEGINRYNFWVSNSVLEYWTELPDITAEQLCFLNFLNIFSLEI